MYGLVNQGIKDLFIEKSNEEEWIKLCNTIQVPTEFVSMHSYDDSVTQKLVGAVAEHLHLSPEQVLQAYGKYWIQYTAKKGYGTIMDLFGSDFKSCLENLNQLHARMGVMMPNLRPPQFAFKELEKNRYHVTYSSERQGLGPMVVGLFFGLAERFGNEIEVTEMTATTQAINYEIRVRR